MEQGTTLADLDAAVGVATAIVCDWNGMIVDDADRALLATNRTLAAFGFAPLDDEQFRSTFRLPMRDFVRALGIAEDDCVNAISRWNSHLSAGETRLQPGVGELLDTARSLGVPVGVVSAAAEIVVRADAVSLGIVGQLSFIAGSVESKSSELTEIATSAGGPILYVGDTEYDVIEARKAGVVAVGFGRGYRPASAIRAARPLLVIDDFTVLSAALLRTRSSLAAVK